MAASTLQLLQFDEHEDALQWKLTNHGTYMANSFYNLVAGIGKTRDAFPALWKTKAPPTVKFFFYALLNDRLLTKHVMRRKKIRHGATDCVQAMSHGVRIASLFSMSICNIYMDGVASLL
jgi:zinc-binding in reverse transcriptase